MLRQPKWTHMVRTRSGNVYAYAQGDRLLAIGDAFVPAGEVVATWDPNVTRNRKGARGAWCLLDGTPVNPYVHRAEQSKVGERPYTVKVWERDPEDTSPEPLLLPFLAVKHWSTTPSGRNALDVELHYRDFPPPPRLTPERTPERA